MAERPDLDYALPILRTALVGRRVERVGLRNPIVLRIASAGLALDQIVGRTISAVERRLQSIVITLGTASDAVSLQFVPMLAGRFALRAPGDRLLADTALELGLDVGSELRYRDDAQMGKVYVVRAGDLGKVPGFATLGVDVLDDAAFTREVFGALVKGRREQVRVFLMDKAALDSLGNAYADEVLWEAGLHPKTPANRLDSDAIVRLHAAIPKVLRDAVAQLERRRPALDVKLRDFLAVRNKHGQPCVRCGTTIRRAGVRGHDTFFCPTCQPDVSGRGLVDWRKLP